MHVNKVMCILVDHQYDLYITYVTGLHDFVDIYIYIYNIYIYIYIYTHTYIESLFYLQKVFVRDCILVRSGRKRNDNPYVAKVASFWQETGNTSNNLLASVMSYLTFYSPCV